MKVRLTIDLDIPEGYYRCDEEDANVSSKDLPKHHLDFVKEAVYRSFINFAKCQHLVEALEWSARKNTDMRDEHCEWAEIITQGEKTLRINKL